MIKLLSLLLCCQSNLTDEVLIQHILSDIENKQEYNRLLSEIDLSKFDTANEILNNPRISYHEIIKAIGVLLPSDNEAVSYYLNKSTLLYENHIASSIIGVGLTNKLTEEKAIDGYIQSNNWYLSYKAMISKVLNQNLTKPNINRESNNMDNYWMPINKKLDQYIISNRSDFEINNSWDKYKLLLKLENQYWEYYHECNFVTDKNIGSQFDFNDLPVRHHELLVQNSIKPELAVGITFIGVNLEYAFRIKSDLFLINNNKLRKIPIRFGIPQAVILNNNDLFVIVSDSSFSMGKKLVEVKSENGTDSFIEHIKFPSNLNVVHKNNNGLVDLEGSSWKFTLDLINRKIIDFNICSERYTTELQLSN